MTKNALAIRCLGATMPTGELLLSRRFSPQRVLQLFTLQLSTSPAPLYSRSETESRRVPLPCHNPLQINCLRHRTPTDGGVCLTMVVFHQSGVDSSPGGNKSQKT